MALEDHRSGEGGSGSARSRPTCTNCGRRSAPRAYTLHFAREEGDDRQLDLQLCEPCLDEIAREPNVELV